MVKTLLTFFAVGVVTMIGAGLVFSLLGLLFSLSFGLAKLLIFNVAPAMLVGWIVLKIVDRVRTRSFRNVSDRRWLGD